MTVKLLRYQEKCFLLALPDTEIRPNVARQFTVNSPTFANKEDAGLNKQETKLPTINELEDQIASEMMPTIQPYLALLQDAYFLSAEIFRSALPEVNPSLAKQICCKLLMRLNNDLRAIFMLVNVGYDVQANCVAASVYECAFTIGTIWDNPELSKEWINWDDPKKTFRDAFTLTKMCLENYGQHKDWTNVMYKLYRQLCWGKHLNPIAEQQGGMERGGNIIDYIPGPRADDLTLRGVCFCCAYAVLFTLIGMQMFIQKHTKPENQQLMTRKLQALGIRQHDLYKEGLARWGSSDPFPGDW